MHHDADNNEIAWNHVSGNTSTGIRLQEKSSENDVHHNTSTGNPDGIRLQNGGGADVGPATNNNIHHNDVNGNAGRGIDLRADSDRNKVHHNYASANVGTDIELRKDADKNKVHHNTADEIIDSGAGNKVFKN